MVTATPLEPGDQGSRNYLIEQEHVEEAVRPKNTGTLQDLQRQRLGQQETAEQRSKAREAISERLRSEFMVVGHDAIENIRRTGVRFEQLDDKRFLSYQLMTRTTGTRPRDWGRCGTGPAEVLRVGDNPYAKSCNGFVFVPLGGSLVYLFMVAIQNDNDPRMCIAQILNSTNNEPVYTFPCGENIFTIKREDIRRLVEQATRSALSR